MWFDKHKRVFHLEDRDVVDVVAKLRFMATQIENGSFGALTLNALGDVFGNEFWNLLTVQEHSDLVLALRDLTTEIARTRRGFIG